MQSQVSAPARVREGVALKTDDSLEAMTLAASDAAFDHPDAELLRRHSPVYVILPDGALNAEPPTPDGKHDYHPRRVESYLDGVHGVRQLPTGLLGWVHVGAVGAAVVAGVALAIGVLSRETIQLPRREFGLLLIGGIVITLLVWFGWRFVRTPRSLAALRERVRSDEHLGEGYAMTVLPSLAVAPEIRAWGQYTFAVGDQPAPAAVYARTVHEHGEIVLQYWQFYYYNHWWNKHEADWEVVMVFCDASTDPPAPRRVAYSSHLGGRWREWSEVEPVDGRKQHPRVYVARGSHAQYFAAAEGRYDALVSRPWGLLDLRGRLTINWKTDFVGRPTLPEGRYDLVAIPPGAETVDKKDAEAWSRWWWLQFKGRWGASEGILGPFVQEEGKRWGQPTAWAKEFCEPDGNPWPTAVEP